MSIFPVISLERFGREYSNGDWSGFLIKKDGKDCYTRSQICFGQQYSNLPLPPISPIIDSTILHFCTYLKAHKVLY